MNTNERIASLTTLTFGTPVEGGFFAGYINTPEGIYGIAVAPKAEGEIKGQWLKAYKEVPRARSYFDCRANTEAMAEAGSDIAQRILALDINGYTDWALPSRDVLELLYRNLKPTTRQNIASFRDGDNPSSLPIGYPYTRESPVQTTAEAFRAGGVEAFEPQWYWASTQYSQDRAWGQDFSGGDQNGLYEDVKFFARAVRRFNPSVLQSFQRGTRMLTVINIGTDKISSDVASLIERLMAGVDSVPRSTASESAGGPALPSPAIAQPGERYAGIAFIDGKPSHHLFLLDDKPSNDLTQEQAKEWAAGLGASLPTRFEAALLYANLQDQFDTSKWHWTETQYSQGHAWGQSFDDGDQSTLNKYTKFSARAVRRLPL